ncbi:TetR family transcriptional regulator [Vogesella sp. LIG4]|uniref:TetR family transcriptional regulator n=1 Tax=Vogesella sp. LIG4 TaxID=1192162 RepID=UPI0008200DD5|nr:TetR family transcriptional regulator [Vogesella sp. LIG4]SCK08882.1 transcriptional regulator, TetR family [Vogesella sp. LIG4]
MTTKDADKKAPRRKNDPEGLKKRILDAAITEFAQTGLSGSTLDAIAERAGTTKRMVVYHFQTKEELYIAALERCYGEIRDIETGLALQHLAPAAAMVRLAEFTFDYHASHTDFIRLVSIENIHQARHLRKSEQIRSLNRSVIAEIDAVLQRGKAEGIFRQEVDAVDLHMLISSFCFFRVANRYTFETLFGRDMVSEAARDGQRRMLVEMVQAYLRPQA